MELVILESPFAGDVDENIEYARRCVRDSLLRGEAPIASHLLYTQPGVLDDAMPADRRLGIDAGLAWLGVAEATVVYTDRGVSNGMVWKTVATKSVVYLDKGITQGMECGVDAAAEAGVPVEYRRLEKGFDYD